MLDTRSVSKRMDGRELEWVFIPKWFKGCPSLAPVDGLAFPTWSCEAEKARDVHARSHHSTARSTASKRLHMRLLTINEAESEVWIPVSHRAVTTQVTS